MSGATAEGREPWGALSRRAAKLAFPIAAGYLLVVAAMLVEVAVVGSHEGPAAVAALGLAGTLSLVIVLSFHAVELACQTIVARRFGEGNSPAAGAVLDNALLSGLAISVPLAAVLWLLGPLIFSTSESEEVRALATEYLRWRVPGIPFYVLILALIGFFNGIHRPKVCLGIFAVVLLLNTGLVFLFVPGWGAIPRLGVAGAGLANTVAGLCGVVLFAVVLARGEYRHRFRCLHWEANLGLLGIKSLLLVGAPVFVQQFFGNFCIYVFQAVISMIDDGGASLAASTLARNMGYLTYLPSLGFGLAAASMVSLELGRGDHAAARRSGFVCWAMGAAVMMGIGALFAWKGHELAALFFSASKSAGQTLEQAAPMIDLTARLLLVIAAYQVFEAMNTILGKALQGAGATRFVMRVTVLVQWVLFVPLAYAAVHWFGWGVLGAWLAFAAQISIAGLVFCVVFLRGRWQAHEI